MRRSVAPLLLSASVLAACGSDDDSSSSDTVSNDTGTAPATTAPATTGPTESAASTTDVQRFPDVLAVEATAGGDGTWSFAVTISSPYDTPERYADGWRVIGPDGEVHGEHTLTHDHAAEQPFTRTQRGVEIPSDVSEVTIEGRDQQYGYGGGAATITLDR